jgi:hypothetical protein
MSEALAIDLAQVVTSTLREFSKRRRFTGPLRVSIPRARINAGDVSGFFLDGGIS